MEDWHGFENVLDLQCEQAVAIVRFGFNVYKN